MSVFSKIVVYSRCLLAIFFIVTSHSAASADDSLRAAIETAELNVLEARDWLGPDHQETLLAEFHLANLYQSSGNFSEAKHLLEHVLEVESVYLDNEDPTFLMLSASLGGVLVELRELDEADSLLKNVYRLSKKRFEAGDENALSPLLTSANNLSALYAYSARFLEAEELAETVYARRKSYLGAEDPATLTSAGNLAWTYQMIGRFSDAEQLNRETYEILQRVAGDEHPQTLISAANLGMLYLTLGRFDEAEQLLARAYDLQSSILGSESTGSLSTAENLARLYQATGRFDKAEKLFLETHSILLRVNGPEHVSTLTVAGEIAMLYLFTGRFLEADQLMAQTYEKWLRAHGAEHDGTLNGAAYLATVYEGDGRLSKARQLLEQIYQTNLQKFGSAHPRSLASASRLEGHYRMLGRMDEAEELAIKNLDGVQKVFGPNHPSVFSAKTALVDFYGAKGNFAEAVDLAAEVYDATKAVLGDAHPAALEASLKLAYTLGANGSLLDARELAIDTRDRAVQMYGKDDSRILPALFAVSGHEMELGNYEAGVAIAMQVLELTDTTYGAQSLNTINAKVELAAKLQLAGNLFDAEALAVQALQDLDNVIKNNDLLKQRAYEVLYHIHMELGNIDEAEIAYRKTVAITKAKFGLKHPASIIAEARNGGAIYLRRGRNEEALKSVYAYLETTEAVWGPKNTRTLQAKHSLAIMLQLQGRYSEAVDVLDQIISFSTESLGEKHPNTIEYKAGLAELYAQLNRSVEAESLLLEVIGDFESTYGLSHLRTLGAYRNLGSLYGNQDKLESAERVTVKVLEALEVDNASDELFLKFTLCQLLEIHLKNGDLDKARILVVELLARAKRGDLQRGALRRIYFDVGWYFELANEDALSVAFLKYSMNLGTGFKDQEEDILSATLRKTTTVHSELLQQGLMRLSRWREAEYVGRMQRSKNSDISLSETVASDLLPLTKMEAIWEEQLEGLTEGSSDKGAVPVEVLDRGERWLDRVMSISDAQLERDWKSLAPRFEQQLTEWAASIPPRTAMLQIVTSETHIHFFLVSPELGFRKTQRPIERDQFEALLDTSWNVLSIDSQRGPMRQAPSLRTASARSSDQIQPVLLELHEMFFSPIRPMLEEAGIEHLVLNLPGRVQYVPFAALFDGNKYLIQDYSFSRFVWGDLDYIPAKNLTRSSMGFGMSKPSGDFSALPGVEEELDEIFTGRNTEGVLAANPLLDEEFTRIALEETLRSPPSILHIASHFAMKPGKDASDSFLLLGDGSHLTLKEISNSPSISFRGVKLLVLSACSTARTSGGNGIEVEGLGAVAQLRGAESVLATIWNVGDFSSAEFMPEFYRQLKIGSVSKAEAVRATQIKMIESKGTLADFSHPYYWSPYILMGNWQ